MARFRPQGPRDWTVLALLALAVVALVVRFIGLGDRVAHFDEARVAHDALRYHKSGVWYFEPVIHGPFLPKVTNLLFAVLGPTDTAIRLPAAILGGVAPLAAWLFREHLRREELLAFAALLAANPILLYYSRFMRNDVPVAVVMLFVLGLLVRAYDTGRSRYLYPVGLLVGLGLSMKGNAILYPVAWFGALAVLGYLRYVAGDPLPDLGRYLDADRRRPAIRSLWERLRPWVRDSLGGTIVGLGLVAVLYAPRGPNELTVAEVITRPAAIGGFIHASLIDPASRMIEYWVYSGSTDTPFISYFTHYVETLRAGALVVLVFALVGFLAVHIGTRRPREFVLFATAWGVASVVGYPIAADIRAPWLAVHAVIPLAIPASVGLGIALRTAYESLADEDWVDVAVAGIVLLAAAGLVLWPAVSLVYLHPAGEDNDLVQYAQPGGDWDDTLERMQRLAEDNDGVDVLFVGSKYAMFNESHADQKPAADGWYDRLPLPWYIEAADGVPDSVVTEDEFDAAFGVDPPPVVVVDPASRNLVAEHVTMYDHRKHLMRLWNTPVHIYLAPA